MPNQHRLLLIESNPLALQSMPHFIPLISPVPLHNLLVSELHKLHGGQRSEHTDLLVLQRLR